MDAADVINVHYAALPKYRGMHPIVWAILNGEKHVGFTFHQMDEFLDSGPIFYQELFDIKNYSSWELMQQIDSRLEKITGSIIEKYMNDEYEITPQRSDDAIFVAKRNLADCRVNWKEWNAEYFQRILKALVTPYPLPFFEHRTKKIEILRAEIDFRDYIEIPGHLVNIDAEFVWIKLVDGLLKIKEIIIDDQKINAVDYFKFVGIRLQ